MLLFGIILYSPSLTLANEAWLNCWRNWDMNPANCGRRRTEEEVHAICHGASDQIKGMFKQTLAILSGEEPNRQGLVKMAKNIRKWCSTLEDVRTQRQCKGYAGLLMEMIKQPSDDEHLAASMLVSAYGDKSERQSACGLIVRTLNQALRDGKFRDIRVTEEKTSGKWRDDDLKVDAVVAKTQKRAEAIVGPVKEYTLELAVSFGTGVVASVYFLIEICHDYSLESLPAPL